MTNFLLRFFDVIASLFAILILIPFYLLIAVLIKVTSPGPVFFIQNRIGLHRREFRMIKYRTMRTDKGNPEILVTASGDSRITFVGKLLRRTKLDELPELWNVLIGDMSLVGPRPEVQKYVAHYKPEWSPVFSIRPGITDLATLQFRDEETVLADAVDTEKAYIDVILPIKINLALKYVENYSVLLYCKILILTVWSITLGRYFSKPEQSLAIEAKSIIFKEKLNKKEVY